jgi:predicted nucleic-acid-binding Zn-ribbon protein
MTIKELKKELSLSNSDIAKFFDVSHNAYRNSTAKTRYENALCRFYEFLKSEGKK